MKKLKIKTNKFVFYNRRKISIQRVIRGRNIQKSKNTIFFSRIYFFFNYGAIFKNNYETVFTVVLGERGKM